jgi:isopenicillin N synthase-like dioxygenase
MNERLDDSSTAPRLSFDSIPIVSLTSWFSGSTKEQVELANKINSVCRTIGFMYISDHGIPESMLQSVFNAAHQFFALSDDEKGNVHYSKSNYHRGYIPLGGESTDPSAKADQKEAFDCGLIYAVDKAKYPDAAVRAMTPNLWTESIPRFRDDVEHYLNSVTNLARTLFSIWAVGFGMPGNFFQEKIDSPIAQLRLLHYPPANGPVDRDYLGIGTHCDYECLTILAQDDIGGLEVKNSLGQWVEAPPIKGAFVVNIGEMMARWTNDLFVATPHRVINRSRQSRYSIPFFFATNYDTVISCLPSCVTPNYPARYEPIVAGQYLAKRLKDIYGV